MRRALVAALAALLALTAAAVDADRARADGDPASDYLITQDVFYPLTPPRPTPAVKERLEAAVRASKTGKAPIKVAIIASPSDLGAIPQVFGKPQVYAPFLAQEIKYVMSGPLLIVMPGGYGVAQVTPPPRGSQATPVVGAPPPAVRDAVARLKPVGNAQVDALVRAATEGVAVAARARGVAIPVPAGAAEGGSKSGRSWTPILAAAAVAVLVLAAAGVVLLRRRRPASTPTPAPSPSTSARPAPATASARGQGPGGAARKRAAGRRAGAPGRRRRRR